MSRFLIVILLCCVAFGCQTTKVPDGWNTADPVRVAAATGAINAWVEGTHTDPMDAVIIAAGAFCAHGFRDAVGINPDTSSRALAIINLCDAWLKTNGYDEKILLLLRARVVMPALDIRDSELALGLLRASLAGLPPVVK